MLFWLGVTPCPDLRPGQEEYPILHPVDGEGGVGVVPPAPSCWQGVPPSSILPRGVPPSCCWGGGERYIHYPSCKQSGTPSWPAIGYPCPHLGWGYSLSWPEMEVPPHHPDLRWGYPPPQSGVNKQTNTGENINSLLLWNADGNNNCICLMKT